MASDRQGHAGDSPKLILAWGFVGSPLVWGLIQTLATRSRRFTEAK